MTALIDMPKLVKKDADQKCRSIDKGQILEVTIIVKAISGKRRTEKASKLVRLIMFAVDSCSAIEVFRKLN